MTLYRRYRKEKGLTQQEMADLLEINVNTYAYYDCGKRRMPYPLLAKFLEIRGYEDDLKLAKILRGI